jgi:hypothetical protein
MMVRQIERLKFVVLFCFWFVFVLFLLLLFCFASGFHDIVAYLLRLGADPSLKDTLGLPRDGHDFWHFFHMVLILMSAGETALMRAVSKGKFSHLIPACLLACRHVIFPACMTSRPHTDSECAGAG